MRNRYIRALENNIIYDAGTSVNGETEYWQSILTSTGSELLETLRIRSNIRGVFLVRHPVYGKCILKTSSPVHEPIKGFANMSIADLVTETNPGIFPRILESSRTYTFEEYIPGLDFSSWIKKNDNLSPVEDYFSKLKKWSLNCVGNECSEKLLTDEIRMLSNSYIQKYIRHLNYRHTTKFLHSSYLLSKRRKKYAEESEKLWHAAANLSLPRCMMCGDMGALNIIVASKSNKMFNIDYEYMGVGHYAFDAVCFIVSLFSVELSNNRKGLFTNLLLTDEFLGGKENREYFRALAKMLLEIEQIVFSPEKVI